MLELAALTLTLTHFSIPLAYYWHAKSKWLNKPWNIQVNEEYKPKFTVILPTYNESEVIQERLENIYNQDYPKEFMELIVVDSASTDGTADLVRRWAQDKNLSLKLLEEKRRKGKLSALQIALKEVSPESEVVVFTDADAFWEKDALKKTAKYFADPKVGSITASMRYTKVSSEESYRDFFNKIRIAESKAHSTPVHNGPFLAIRAKIIHEYGLPNYLGSDDSAFGSFVAFLGYRAIQVDDILVKELLRGSTFLRKVRRAQHLILNFLKTKKLAKDQNCYRSSDFDRIWRIEWWLHIINPWLLLVGLILLMFTALHGSLLGLGVLVIGSSLLLIKVFRVWILQQIYLIIAMLRSPWTREIAWRR